MDFDPGVFRLRMNVEQQPVGPERTMDRSQGAHGALSGDSSERPGEKRDIKRGLGQSDNGDVGDLKGDPAAEHVGCRRTRRRDVHSERIDSQH